MKHRIQLSIMLAVSVAAMTVQNLNAGVILRLYYDGISGTSVSALTNSPFFPGAPTFWEVLTETLEGVENEPDNYGSWIRGYLEAPETGDYTFWIASDDDSELWLSTDHTVANRRKIAENVGAVGNREFEAKPMQRSIPIALERGKKYYLEALHKDGAGAAHISVGWQLPDGTLQRPIPGERLLPFPVDGAFQPRQTAPMILADYFSLPVPVLADVTVSEGQPAVFSVTVEATQPATFQWLRDSLEIPGAILSSYRLASAAQSDHGARFSVRISNSLGTVTSDAVLLTVQPDVEPPALVGATTRGNPNGVDVRFSEAVDSVPATNPANYQIAPGVNVTGAALIDNQTVRLTTSTIAEGSVYTLTVNNVKDRSVAGNTIASNSQLTFMQVQGVITEKEFKDIPGPLLTDLTGNAKFPANPDAGRFSSSFETTPLRRDNYGVQFQGFVIPPVTGEYLFYVSSRDQSALFLSPDDKPVNMAQIASETGFSTPRNWETPRADGLNVSAPQMLVAGKKYYLEGRFKAAARTGAAFVDHFAVTWQKPGDAPPANGDPPIPGEFLSSLATLGPVTITQAPASQTLTELETAIFNVGVDGTPPYTFQWLKNDQPIAGGTERTLTIPEANLADNGAEISVRVMNAFSEATSASALLTVNRDTTPPAIQEITARNIATAVNVLFSEPIDPVEAEKVSNYAIAPGITVSTAELQTDGRTVTLTTSALSGGIQYTLTVNNIKDRASQPNTISANTTKPFTFFGTDRVIRRLQVLYTFREGAGNTVTDVSGVGTPLDLEIREPEKVTWLPGGGLALNSETRIVSFNPATKINEAAKAANELTVEVWVKPANIEQQGPARIVTVSQGPNAADRNFSFNQGRFGEAPENRAKWTARGSVASGLGDFSTPNGTATTELQQVVFTHNASAGEARIYVDGVEVDSRQPTGNFSDWVVDRGLVLGNENTLVGSGRFWLGELHLVAVYSAALSPEEVQQNFQVGPGPSRVTDGLQALYTFQEGSGTTISDVSGVGIPLNLEIREPEKVTWLPGGGLSLNSETRVVSFNPATKINEAAKAANELTVEVWVKPANIEQQGPARIVAVSQGPNAADRNFSFNQGRFGETPENRAKWTARGSVASALGDFSTPNGTATTELQHVVFTHNASAGEAHIYVDGVEVDSRQPTGNFSDWVVDRELVLGNENTLVGSGRFWLGELHLVAVYSRALTAGQVTQNFEAGPGTRPSGSSPPSLAIQRAGDDMVLSWRVGAQGFTLEATPTLSPASWTAVPGTPVVAGDQNTVTIQIGAGAAFYRLRK